MPRKIEVVLKDLIDLTNKLTEAQTPASLIDDVVIPVDKFVESYNKMIFKMTKYYQKLANLEQYKSKRQLIIDDYNNALEVLKKDKKACILSSVKIPVTTTGGGKKVESSGGGILSDLFLQKKYKSMNIEERIKSLDALQTKIRNTNDTYTTGAIKKDYDDFITSIKDYKKLLVNNAKNQNSISIVNNLKKYLDVLDELKNIKCETNVEQGCQQIHIDDELQTKIAKSKQKTSKVKEKLGYDTSMRSEVQKKTRELFEKDRIIGAHEKQLKELRSAIKKYKSLETKQNSLGTAAKGLQQILGAHKSAASFIPNSELYASSNLKSSYGLNATNDSFKMTASPASEIDTSNLQDDQVDLIAKVNEKNEKNISMKVELNLLKDLISNNKELKADDVEKFIDQGFSNFQLLVDNPKFLTSFKSLINKLKLNSSYLKSTDNNEVPKIQNALLANSSKIQLSDPYFNDKLLKALGTMPGDTNTLINSNLLKIIATAFMSGLSAPAINMIADSSELNPTSVSTSQQGKNNTPDDSKGPKESNKQLDDDFYKGVADAITKIVNLSLDQNIVTNFIKIGSDLYNLTQKYGNSAPKLKINTQPLNNSIYSNTKISKEVKETWKSYFDKKYDLDNVLDLFYSNITNKITIKQNVLDKIQDDIKQKINSGTIKSVFNKIKEIKLPQAAKPAQAVAVKTK